MRVVQLVSSSVGEQLVSRLKAAEASSKTSNDANSKLTHWEATFEMFGKVVFCDGASALVMATRSHTEVSDMAGGYAGGIQILSQDTRDPVEIGEAE